MLTMALDLHILLLAAAALLALGAPAGAEEGLRPAEIEDAREEASVFWRDFDKGLPADAVRAGEERDGQMWYGENPPESFWAVRRPGWTPCLLNARGTPPDLTLAPGIAETCDIYLGLRSVDPIMALGIRLASEKEFTTITAPAATRDHHFDFEFHWKCAVPMAGEKIVLHALGKPLYLQYLRFVPHVRKKVTLRVPEANVPIIREKGRHFAFPGVAELANGDLVVVAREGDAHVCPHGRIVMARSTDGGKTWSPRETVYETPSDERDPAVICLKDGTVVLSFNTWLSWLSYPSAKAQYAKESALAEKEGWRKYSGSWTMVSRDHGKTWSEARKSPIFSTHGPVEGPDGALYWVGLEGRDGASVVAIYRTADLGQTWSRFSEVSYSRAIADAVTWEAWDEPNLVFLPGGKAVCSIRVDLDGFVRQAYSQDGGKTWGWPKKLKVWGFPQQLCRLPDGRLVMGYGYRRQPFGVRACLSGDDGRTWDLAREIVFRQGGVHGDLGYAYSIPLRDGRVCTVYYYNEGGGDCWIEGAFYRP